MLVDDLKFKIIDTVVVEERADEPFQGVVVLLEQRPGEAVLVHAARCLMCCKIDVSSACCRGFNCPLTGRPFSCYAWRERQ